MKFLTNQLETKKSQGEGEEEEEEEKALALEEGAGREGGTRRPDSRGWQTVWMTGMRSRSRTSRSAASLALAPSQRWGRDGGREARKKGRQGTEGVEWSGVE